MRNEYFTDNINDENLIDITDKIIKFEKNKINTRRTNMFKIIPAAASLILVIGLISVFSYFPNLLNLSGDEVNPSENIYTPPASNITDFTAESETEVSTIISGKYERYMVENENGDIKNIYFHGSEVNALTITTPKGQNPIDNKDGTFTLPGGGMYTVGSDTVIVSEGITIRDDGSIPGGTEYNFDGKVTIKESDGTLTIIEVGTDKMTIQDPDGTITVLENGKIIVDGVPFDEIMAGKNAEYEEKYKYYEEKYSYLDPDSDVGEYNWDDFTAQDTDKNCPWIFYSSDNHNAYLFDDGTKAILPKPAFVTNGYSPDDKGYIIFNRSKCTIELINGIKIINAPINTKVDYNEGVVTVTIGLGDATVIYADGFEAIAENGTIYINTDDIPRMPAPPVNPEDITEDLTRAVCIHDNDSSFHDCQVVYDYLEEQGRTDEYNQWQEDMKEKGFEENDRVCTYKYINIYDCMKYFNIPQDFFEDWYTDGPYVSCDFDIDLLYNGTREEVFEYYYDIEARYITRKQKGSDFNFKVHMIIVMDMLDQFSIAANTFSIPEFIYASGMTKEQFYAAGEQAKRRNNATMISEYNIDDVYENREYYEGLIGTMKPYYIDEMIKVK